MKETETEYRFPQICADTCIRCGLCIADCIADAINSPDMSINYERCIRCSHCSAICPTAAVSWRAPEGTSFTGHPVHDLPAGFSGELANLLKRRRSIRRFSGKELPHHLIQDIIEITNHSPTGTNSRGVGITVISGSARMREFSDLCMLFFRRISRIVLNPLSKPVLRIFMGKKAFYRLMSYNKHIDRYFAGRNNLTHGAAALFVFHADRKSSCPSEDALIWAAHAALYAESLGVGTCYNGFIVRAARYSKAVRHYLGLPPGHRVYETFTAGFSAHSYQRSAFHEVAYSRVIS
ncbi:nitroreductase family protein [Spirochaeta dissipatitropha]